MILDIVFSFGVNLFYGENTPWWINFAINLFGVFVGALLAYIIAISMYKKQRRVEKENDLEKAKNLNIGRLRHFITIFSSAIKISEKQSQQYTELSGIITKLPYEYHHVNITLTNDFQRIKSLDNQKIFEAYFNIISNTQDGIKKYTNIFHTIDYVDIRLVQMFNMHKKHNDFTFSDQTVVRDIIEDLVNILETLLREITEDYPDDYQNIPVYAFVENRLMKSKSDDKKDFKYFESEFIIPLVKECRSYFSFNKGLANLTFQKCKRALARLKQIEFNSIEHAKNCAKLKEELNPKINELKAFNEELKKNAQHGIADNSGA